MKKLSSFMVKPVSEGNMVAFTYSVISDEGEITARNEKRSFLAMDDALNEHIAAIANYIKDNKLD